MPRRQTLDSLRELSARSIIVNIDSYWLKEFLEKQLDKEKFVFVLGPFTELPLQILELLMTTLFRYGSPKRHHFPHLTSPLQTELDLSSWFLKKCRLPIAQFPVQYQALRQLSLRHLPKTSATRSLEQCVAGLPELVYLDLSFCGLSSALGALLFAHCRKLQVLLTEGCKGVSDAFVTGLAGGLGAASQGPLPLTRLACDSCDLTPEALALLLQRTPRLDVHPSPPALPRALWGLWQHQQAGPEAAGCCISRVDLGTHGFLLQDESSGLRGEFSYNFHNYMTKVDHVILDMQMYEGRILGTVVQLSHVTHLVISWFYQHPPVLLKDALAALGDRLQLLNITDAALTLSEMVTCCPRLESLTLTVMLCTNTAYTSPDAHASCSCPALHALETLEVEGRCGLALSERLSEDAAHVAAAAGDHLAHLQLAGLDLTDDQLARALTSSSLARVQLAQCTGCGNAPLEAVVRAENNLEKLELLENMDIVQDHAERLRRYCREQGFRVDIEWE